MEPDRRGYCPRRHIIARGGGSADGRFGGCKTRNSPFLDAAEFAFIAVLLQLAELAVGFALRRFALGRYSLIGCVLPAPAFLVVLFALSFAIQDRSVAMNATAAVETVTAIWLALLGGIVLVLNRIDNPWENGKFANDFALMTSCTALIFVPFGQF